MRGKHALKGIRLYDWFFSMQDCAYICTLMMTMPLFISGTEIAFIVFVLVMVFGADKVPEIARGLGKGIRIVKDATNDVKTEITKTTEKHGLDTDITSTISTDIKKQIGKVKEDIDDITGGSIKRKF